MSTFLVEQVEDKANYDWGLDGVQSNGTAKIDTFTVGDEDRFDSEDEEEDEDIEFQDMQLFLYAIGEPQLVDKFLNNKVTLGQLLEFNEEDLINCGIDLVGDRKKILENTGKMHSEKWMPYSLQDLTTKTMLSSPGIYISLNDINKHTEFIGVTFKYLRRRLQEKPEILELGKDYVGVAKIFSELEDLLKTSKSTYNQLKALQREIIKHTRDPNMLPANHIDDNYIMQAKLRRNLRPVLVITITVLISYKIVRLFI